MRKNKQFSIRISEQDLEAIRRKAAQAHMTQSAYVTACCLGKRIVIMDGLKEVLRQQKAIGNNLNRLTVLANMGKVQFANLDTAAQEFAKINVTLRQMQALRVRNDQICEELRLPKFQKDEQRQVRGMSNAEYYPAAKGESWKFELMRVIDECMRCAGNREEFLVLLRSEGYDATWTDSRKNITYTTPDGRKCRDSKLHMTKYRKENMEAEFGYRTEIEYGSIGSAAQEIDGRGAAAGTGRDGDGTKLERDAQNAARSVSAADTAGRGPENAPDEGGSTGIPDQDADERRRVCKTGWEPEREVFFRLQSTDREYEARPDRDSERYKEAAFEYGAGDAEENPDVRVDLDYSADLVRGAVRLGRAVEQMTDNAPQHDGTTMPPHIDSKRRKKLRQKKTALGHAEDDHEDWNMEQKM